MKRILFFLAITLILSSCEEVIDNTNNHIVNYYADAQDFDLEKINNNDSLLFMIKFQVKKLEDEKLENILHNKYNDRYTVKQDDELNIDLDCFGPRRSAFYSPISSINIVSKQYYNQNYEENSSLNNISKLFCASYLRFIENGFTFKNIKIEHPKYEKQWRWYEALNNCEEPLEVNLSEIKSKNLELIDSEKLYLYISEKPENNGTYTFDIEFTIGEKIIKKEIQVEL